MSETYGKYQLLKKLATGGMAQIYLARHAGFEHPCVVKRILPHLAENHDFVTMFLDEAKIAARLNHPNIVQIHDLGTQDDSFFLAMEYIHGEDLRRVWKRAEHRGEGLPVGVVLRIMADACAGLDYAHKKTENGRPLGIVHRDISPQNILVSFDGAVKVVDFGIAKAADKMTETRSGVLKGKYSYMSPEQALGRRDVDARTDIFALGVVLYELLTGSRLFKRSNEVATLQAVIECRVVPPSEVNARVPRSLDGVVLKALAKSADDRYAHAEELQLAIERWLLEHQTAVSSAHVAAYLRELYADSVGPEDVGGPGLRDAPEVPSLEVELPPRRKAPVRTSSRAGALPVASPRATPSREENTAAMRPVRTGSRSRISRPGTPAVKLVMPPPVTELPPETSPRVTDVSVSRLRERERRGVGLALSLAALAGAAAVAVWILRPTEVAPPPVQVNVETSAPVTPAPTVTPPPERTEPAQLVETVVVEPEPSPAPAPAAVVEKASAVIVREKPRPSRVEARPEKSTSVVQQPPEVVRGSGGLRVVIVPLDAWAEVSCGTHRLGQTPFGEKTLPAGTYDCTFTHPELGTKRERVEVRPNAVSTLTVKFE